MSGFVNLDDHFTTTLARDTASLIIGDNISTGQFRDVYQHATAPSYVIKLENVERSFCNQQEWLIWEAAKEDKHLRRWFAPCDYISPTGVVLIMRKTFPIRPGELPKRVPSFFADLKDTNWGIYEGRPVCHDYGNHEVIDNGLVASTKAAKWVIHG